MEFFLITLLVSPLYAHEAYGQACPGGVCPYRPNNAAPVAQPAPIFTAPAAPYVPPTPQFTQPLVTPGFIGGSQPFLKPPVLSPQTYLTSPKSHNIQKFTTPTAKPFLPTYNKIPAQEFPQSHMPYSSLLQSQLKLKKNSDNNKNDNKKIKKEKKIKTVTPLEDLKSSHNITLKENTPFIKDSSLIPNQFSQSEEKKNIVFSLPLKKVLNALNGRNSAELKLLFTPSTQNSDEISVSYAFSNVNDNYNSEPLLTRAANQVKNVTHNIGEGNNAEPLLTRAANQVKDVTHNIVEGSKNMVNNVVDAITSTPEALPTNSSNIDQIKIDSSFNDAVNAQAALDASNAISAY